MFNGCTRLTSAPVLYANNSAANCYRRMFKDCKNLKYIKMLLTDDMTESNSLTDWVVGVSDTGTFVKASS
jgi:hypothetical protein